MPSLFDWPYSEGASARYGQSPAHSIHAINRKELQPIRVAIVHHWFVSLGGGERVVDVLAGMFPNADVFTLLASPGCLPAHISKRTVTTSFLQKLPGATRYHRHLLPLYPFAVEELDLTSYDLVVSSDSGPVKGVITRQDALHVCYCHSPMRYIWDSYYQYKGAMSKAARFPFSLAAHYVRNWDYVAAQRVSQFVANSHYVAKRIAAYYGRDSAVIYPPVDDERGFLSSSRSDYYLAAGRLVPYKKTELLIEACNRLRRRLRVIGSGPEMTRLKRLASPWIEFHPHVATDQLWNDYANCRALLFAADEDFGMVPVEAQACGRPVIAFKKGGALETIKAFDPARHAEGETVAATGILFPSQTVDDVIAAILQFETHEARFSPQTIQAHAAQFSTARFVASMSRLLTDQLPELKQDLQLPSSRPAA